MKKAEQLVLEFPQTLPPLEIKGGQKTIIRLKPKIAAEKPLQNKGWDIPIYYNWADVPSSCYSFTEIKNLIGSKLFKLKIRAIKITKKGIGGIRAREFSLYVLADLFPSGKGEEYRDILELLNHEDKTNRELGKKLLKGLNPQLVELSFNKLR